LPALNNGKWLMADGWKTASHLRSAILFPATWPSGKARVCKTLITGSNPVVASAQPFIKNDRALFGVAIFNII
jgi:hypothetical protein